MNAAQIYDDLVARGVRVSLHGSNIRLRAPGGVIDAGLVERVRVNKTALQRIVTERVIVIDFETRSLAKLKLVGGRMYAGHPSTQVLCCVAELWDGDQITWHPGEPDPGRLLELAAAGVPLIAHNGDVFDRFIWEHLGWPPAVWFDTLPLARALGLPGDLDELAQKLLARSKDRAGHKLTLMLSLPAADGQLRPVTRDELHRVTRYCEADVGLLRDAWRVRLSSAVSREADVRDLDRRINDRGFALDANLAAAVISIEQAAGAELRQSAGVPEQIISSPLKLRKYLEEAGITAPNARRETLVDLLDDPDVPPDAARVIEARIGSTGIAGHKVRAALGRVSPDGRLRDTLVYHAAHTGRWSGRGFQPQNLPRAGKLDLDAAVAAALDRDKTKLEALALAAGMKLSDALGALVRLCVMAPPGKLLGVVDFSSIEARVLLWLAGDTDGLDVFRRGVDVYKLNAARLFGVSIENVDDDQRGVGKFEELGCGFSMGPSRFRSYAEAGGVNWAAVSVTPEDAVEDWRDAHPLVAGNRAGFTRDGRVLRVGGLWRAYEAAAVAAARGQASAVGPVTWERVDSDVVATLPSGRRLVYASARIEQRPTPWGELKPSFAFEHRGKCVSSYGGKVVENVTQAVARDVLVAAMMRLDAAGSVIVLHVHDEIVAELASEHELDAMKNLMEQTPSWAPGLPLAVKGGAKPRYQK